MTYFLKTFFRKLNNAGPLAGRRILVVEDESSQRLMLQRVLEKQGALVVVAQDGNEGLRQAAECCPEVILLDERMPVMTGIQMCKKLKEHEVTKHIPVIFLTAADSSDDIIEHFSLGAEFHLSKPIQAKELVSQILITLNNQKEDGHARP